MPRCLEMLPLVKIRGYCLVRSFRPKAAASKSAQTVSLWRIPLYAEHTPVHILPSEAHDEIRAIQKPLDFPQTVFGVERAPAGESLMVQMMTRYTRGLQKHKDDKEQL